MDLQQPGDDVAQLQMENKTVENVPTEDESPGSRAPKHIINKTEVDTTTDDEGGPQTTKCITNKTVVTMMPDNEGLDTKNDMSNVQTDSPSDDNSGSKTARKGTHTREASGKAQLLSLTIECSQAVQDFCKSLSPRPMQLYNVMADADGVVFASTGMPVLVQREARLRRETPVSKSFPVGTHGHIMWIAEEGSAGQKDVLFVVDTVKETSQQAEIMGQGKRGSEVGQPASGENLSGRRAREHRNSSSS